MTILTYKVWRAYHFKYFLDRINTPPPDLPTLKAYPTPGESGEFEIFLPKMREKDELKRTRSIFIPWLRGENCFVGCCNPPSEN